jgi:cell shape-determining protein MreC
MNREPRHLPLIVWACWVLTILFLRAGPAQLRGRLQLGLQEGCGVVLAAWTSIVPVAEKSPSTPLEEHGRPIQEQLRLENRQLRESIAQLKWENDKLKRASGPEPEAGWPLMQAEAVPARVIGHLGDPLRGNSELLLSLGKQQGLVGQELVLGETGILIDQGTDSGLNSDQLAVFGRGLLGRTTRVSRWTSLVQALTEDTFRIGVRIIRNSPLGPVDGPRGILAGTGVGCRIDEVPATEAVAVGDEVYLDEIIAAGAGPIYCGRVLRVSVAPTASHWSIDVEPFSRPGEMPAELHVLRMRLHPQRVTHR